MATNPRVLFVSRERLRLPFDATQQRKWDAIGAGLDYRILAASATDSPRHDERVRLWPPARPRIADGPIYYAALPARLARALASFDPDAVLVQGVHEAAEVLAVRSAVRSRARVILDVQGDWREATRLYGSRARRLLDPLGDRVGASVVRRVDGIRTLSEFTSAVVRSFGVEPTAEFPPFVDAAIFRDPAVQPLPASPVVLFVGVLERYKGFDTLAAAWPRVAESVPDAELHVVGKGTLARLARELAPARTRWTPTLDADGVRAAMDSATLLCLPSRAEGLGRVVIEAMCRGRGIVGGRAGGIVDLVTDGVDGVLTDPDDPVELADAIRTALSNSGPLGAAARQTGERLALTASQYGEQIGQLVRTVLRT